MILSRDGGIGGVGEGGRKKIEERRKEKEKEKYMGNFGIIRKFGGGRVPKNNLRQLEGTFLVFFLKHASISAIYDN